jgi:hypothetical protein
MLNNIAGIGPFSFTPQPVAGYTVWLDASDTGTITSSGGDVSQWSDKSVNGRNFTQSSATAKPKTGTRTLNGKNVIDFDGSNDFLSCPSSTALFNYFHNSTGATLFIVGIVDDTAASKALINNDGGSTVNSGFRFRITSTEQDNLVIRRGVAGTNNAVIQNNITLTGGSGFYLTNKFDAGNATAANRLKISLNGGAFLGSNVDTGSASASNASFDLHLGIISDLLLEPWNGAFGEIIMYSGILSAGDIADNQAYLAAKWGL